MTRRLICFVSQFDFSVFLVPKDKFDVDLNSYELYHIRSVLLVGIKVELRLISD